MSIKKLEKPELTKLILNTQISQGSENPLRNLISQIKKFEYLDKQLKLNIPSFLQPHCKLAYFDPALGKINLVVSSSAMAAKWHYLKANLLVNLRANPVFAGISSIDIKIDPSVFAQNLNKDLNKDLNKNNLNKNKKFSKQSSELLNQTIQSCQDEKIKKQLEKLLKYAQ